jgi:hypothetical protein
MLGFIRREAKLLLTAGFCLVVGLATPAIGHGVEHALFAHDAHKVDGKHAVGFAATKAVRAGKLVATSRNTGRLPNNIIAKAPNANRLDGIDSSGFSRTGHTHDDLPSDQRFALMYPLSDGTVGWLAVRGDASIRDQRDPNATVTRVSDGRYCVNAPNSREGAVGVLQNQGDDAAGTIRVSMGIGSFCNSVPGTNITVETFEAP